MYEPGFIEREAYAEIGQGAVRTNSYHARRVVAEKVDSRGAKRRASKSNRAAGPSRFVMNVTCTAVAGCFAVNTASAQESVQFNAEYTGDVFAPVSGASQHGAYLDNLDLSATIDMAKFAKWSHDATVFIRLLNTSGGAPNGRAGTLQGVDNIEVTRQSARLYEFWIDTQLGALDARAGLYDVNSEFYANDSAGLLISPAFGVGSELAATGPNGPSIFPSTALAVRLGAQLSAHTSARVALVNAHAGVIGDPGGIDTAFEDGALLIGELSWDGATHVDVGAWTYSDKQRDIRLAGGSPRQRAAGLYLTAEREIYPGATVFARVGVADGDTTPYIGGWQAGVLFDHVLASRPDSQLSLGAYQGRFGSKFLGNQRDNGINAARAETGLEFTYSDQATPWLRLQPDVQVVFDPNGDRDRQDVWVAGLRFVFTPFAT